MQADSDVLCWALPTNDPVTDRSVVRLTPEVRADEVLERAFAWFGTGAPGFTVTCVDGRDDDLALAAADAGFVHHRTSPVMTSPPGEVDELPSGMRVELVDASTVSTFFGVIGSSWADRVDMTYVRTFFSDPDVMTHVLPRQAVLLFDADRAVGAALTYAGGIAGGIYWVGVIPECRKRGYGTMLMRSVMQLLFERGASYVSLDSVPGAEPFYESLGFCTVGAYHHWVRRP